MSLTTRGAVLALAAPVVLLGGIAVNQMAHAAHVPPPTYYQLTECGPDMEFACPTNPPEDAPVWDCTNEGNADCGPTRVTRYEDGSYVVHYSDGDLVVDTRGNRTSDRPSP